MYKISLAVFNRMLYIVTIQSHAHARKYVTYACIREHIQVHVYGETPYMSKSKAAKQRFCEWGAEEIKNYENCVAMKRFADISYRK